MNTSGIFSSKTDEWETPQWLFNEMNEEFHFDLDPAATDENHKCARYFTKEDDGLSKKWGGVCMVQSTLRKTDREMGGESIQRSTEARHNGGYVASCEDRQRMVSRLHFRQSRSAIYQRTATVWREQV